MLFDQVNNDIIHARFDDTELHIELPNRDLYHFTGYGIADEETFTFNEKQMLLRGSRLKNTNFIIGIVLYTGDKTKVMMNSGSAPIKTSFVQKQLNGFVLNMFFVLITYASIGLYGAVSSIDLLEDAWYIPWELRHPSACVKFLRLIKYFFVLFNLRSIFINFYFSIAPTIQQGQFTCAENLTALQHSLSFSKRSFLYLWSARSSL